MRCPDDDFKNYSYRQLNQLPQGDVAFFKQIVRSTIKGDFSIDSVFEYLQGFSIYPLISASISVGSIVFLLVFSFLLCTRCKFNLKGKQICRLVSLVLMYFIFMLFFFTMMLSAPSANASLKSACAFDESRITAYELMGNLSMAITDTNEALEPVIDTIKIILKLPLPSITVINYLNSLNAVIQYNSGTCIPDCSIPCFLCAPVCIRTECVFPTGKYACPLCEATTDLSAPLRNQISGFITDINNTITPPVVENEKYLNLANTSIETGTEAIQDLITLIDELKELTLSESSVTGELFYQGIEYTSIYDKNHAMIGLLFTFILISFILSFQTSLTVQYSRMNCISWLSCPSIILMFALVAIFLPLLIVSNDLCIVLKDIPVNIDYYYDTNPVNIIVETCFGNGTLPKRYLDDLNFADTLDNPPSDTIDKILEAFDNNPLNQYNLVDVSGESSSDPVVQRRIDDIRNLQERLTHMKNMEAALKKQINELFQGIQGLFILIKPTMFEIKDIILSFSCASVKDIYYGGVDGICGDLKIALINLTIILFLSGSLSIAYFFSMCGYLIGDSTVYRRLRIYRRLPPPAPSLH